VRDDLFIRGMFDKRPRKLEELEELGVSTVFSMLRKVDPDLKSDPRVDYRNYPLADSKASQAPQDSLERAWSAAFAAAEKIERGEKVLIHCISARDRCPFTSALTLVLLEGISGKEAMERVHNLKPTTFYNVGYRRYLENLDRPFYTTSDGANVKVHP